MATARSGSFSCNFMRFGLALADFGRKLAGKCLLVFVGRVDERCFSLNRTQPGRRSRFDQRWLGGAGQRRYGGRIGGRRQVFGWRSGRRCDSQLRSQRSRPQAPRPSFADHRRPVARPECRLTAAMSPDSRRAEVLTPAAMAWRCCRQSGMRPADSRPAWRSAQVLCWLAQQVVRRIDLEFRSRRGRRRRRQSFD